MKLRRKLISAGFALGASALTLTTSTFAWYTSNTEVTAAAVSGITSTTADSSNLYIAAAKSYKASTPGAAVNELTAYATTVTPSLVAGVGTNETRYLAPVAFDKVNTDATALTYNTMSASGSDVTYTALTSALSIYEFVLRFQVPNNNTDTPIYISTLSVTNSASATDSQQQALADNTTLGASLSDATQVGIAETGQYNVDMLHALKMTVVATPVTFDSTATGDKYVVQTASAKTTVYDLDGFADTSKDVNIAKESSTYYANAVSYYNTVLGTSISTPTGYLASSSGAGALINRSLCVAAAEATDRSDATAEESTLCTIPSTTAYMEVRFTFWLDGWDSYCYDVCRKQNFTATMGFSTSLKGVKTFTAANATYKVSA